MAGRDTSFASVMNRMLQERRTGVLDVSSADGHWELHLHRGDLIDVVIREGGQWTLGEALVSRGIVGASELAKLDGDARKKGLTVEDVLVSSGTVSPELIERIQTQHLRESALPLFRMVGVFCQFRHEAPSFLMGAGRVPLSTLLNEGKRRTKLWPELVKTIPTNRHVYRRSDGAIPIAFAGYRPAGSASHPAEQREKKPTELSPNQRLILFELNGERTVQQVALASGLGEFETTSALVSLHNAGMIRLVSKDSSGEAPPQVSRLPELVSGLTGALLIAVFAWIAFSWSPDIWFSPPLRSEVVSEGVREARERGLHEALLRSAAENGYFPSRLEDLNAEGWVEEFVLQSSQKGAGWHYVPSRLRDSYTLSWEEHTSPKHGRAPLNSPEGKDATQKEKN